MDVVHRFYGSEQGVPEGPISLDAHRPDCGLTRLWIPPPGATCFPSWMPTMDIPPDLYVQGRRTEDRVHNPMWHVLLCTDALRVEERWIHFCKGSTVGFDSQLHR